MADNDSSDDRMVIPMDPESNWDICPVCRRWLAQNSVFPGLTVMRHHHEDHKRRAQSFMDSHHARRTAGRKQEPPKCSE